MWIGVLEGVAELIIGITIGYFGKWSDRLGRRMPFVKSGYAMSAIAKPIMGLFTSLPLIFMARITERLGKGVRSSARDALLADESSEQTRGRVFGFHRSMDTLGAAIGPVIALIYLSFNPGDYRTMFLIAFIPGVAGVLLTFLIRESARDGSVKSRHKGFFSYLKYWKSSSEGYKWIVAGLLLFAFFNGSDAFLFLMCKEAGVSDRNMILAYVLYNFVFAALSMPAGKMADRIGMRRVIMTGLLCFAVVYSGFSGLNNTILVFVLFSLYGIYGACTDGITRAWISKNCSASEKGTAFGFYKSWASVMSLSASFLTGWIWMNFSPKAALLFSALGAFTAFLYFLLILPKKTTDFLLSDS